MWESACSLGAGIGKGEGGAARAGTRGSCPACWVLNTAGHAGSLLLAPGCYPDSQDWHAQLDIKGICFQNKLKTPSTFLSLPLQLLLPTCFRAEDFH